MAQQPITVVQGHGNIAGNYLNSVGNVVTNITNGPQLERERFKAGSLESKVAFDALLKSEARYPAPRCHPNTRAAVQIVVKNWIRRKGDWADKVIMWISGAPGVGKSAIVQTVCEELGGDDGSKRWFTKFGLSDRDVHGSYFFGRGLGDREKALFFPPTIAYQLSRSKTSCRDAIKQTLKKRPEVLSEDFPSQFRQLLLKTAKKQWSFQSPITIVIDALDECDDANDQVKLLDLIFETATSTNTRFLIASRPEQHIHAFFQRKDVTQHTYHIRLDEESFNTSRDIEVFLRDEFKRIRLSKPELCPPLPNGEDWPGNLIIIRIRDDSDSQFIFPTLIISHIDTPFYPPDEQLQALLSAPPSRAFSKLDALYEHILSRCPPDLREGSDELLAYQKLVLDVFGVVIAWSEPISATRIARVLNRKVTVVQNIILGPMRSLFKFDASKPNYPIMLCHKSLRDYLLDIERSHRFFIPSGEADALFISILSRQPPADQSYTVDELNGVLVVVVHLPGKLSLPAIAKALDVDLLLVERVVRGPANALFDVGSDHTIQFSSSSLNVFLCDVNRSGEFCVRVKDLDRVLIRILSHPPLSDPVHSYSRDDLLNVLAALVVQQEGMSKRGMEESPLRIDPRVVERIISGPAKSLFDSDPTGKIKFSIPLLKPFLQDVGRSGEFSIQGLYAPDIFFLRILSFQPPADPLGWDSREVLIGVLEVLTVVDSPSTIPRIACALGVAPSLVNAVIYGPMGSLFMSSSEGCHFSTPSFKAFLLDPNRAGKYFIRTDRPDGLFLQVLSRQPPPGRSGIPSRELLKGILMVLVVNGDVSISISQIAAVLAIHSDDARDVVFGWAQFLFDVRSFWMGPDDVCLNATVQVFLQDETRAGEFYIPPDHLNPDYESMYAKILKIPKTSYVSNT